MGDVINLNQFRKERARKEGRRKARGNRIRHGRSGAAKAMEREAAAKAGREHDAKRLNHGKHPAGPDSEPPEDGTPSAG